MENKSTYFLPYQARWIRDQSPLKIIEKSRQVGLTLADAYDSVVKAGRRGARLPVYISSRDKETAAVYLNYCRKWARILQIAALDLGYRLIDKDKDLSAYVLRLASGMCIYSLSSTPDAVVGKPGHIKLDEFAVHKKQEELYGLAKPCTMWGGQLAVISTHRHAGTVFNQILRDIRERGNPMGWSHHRVTLAEAVEQGLVERINAKTGRNETREGFMARIRKECRDEFYWLQEYCCIPCDDDTAVLKYEVIRSCEAENCMRDMEYLRGTENPLFVGVDVARRKHLCVIDVGELVGDIIWDRLRIEMRDRSFAEMKETLWAVLRLPKVNRTCIDGTGLGMQLGEEAQKEFPWQVQSIQINGPLKEKLVWQLKAAFEQRLLRIPDDEALREDLRAVRQEFTDAGNARFGGENEGSHCDRFWAKALRQHAFGMRRGEVYAFVG